MKRLVNLVKLGEASNNIEEQVFSADVVIDAGFNLEAYGNPDGKGSESAEGASLFIHVDQDVTFGQLLSAVAHLGSVRDDTLSIRTVANDETVELAFCQENPVSALLDTTATA